MSPFNPGPQPATTRAPERHLHRFYIAGDAHPHALSAPSLVVGGGKVERVRVYCEEAPAGGDLVVSLKRDGAEVASVTVADSQNEAEATALTVGVEDSSRLSVGISAVGPTTPGGYVSVVAEVDPSVVPQSTGLLQAAIASSADDQRIKRTDASYPPTAGTLSRLTSATVCGCWRSYFSGSGDYEVANLLLAFDTSSVPDAAEVHGAELWGVLNETTGPNDRNLVFGWYAWDGSSSTDWTDTPETDAAQVPLHYRPKVDFVDWKIPLSGAGANVLKTGTTRLRGHIDGGTPAESNLIEFFSFDDATYDPPRLLVPYTVW